MQLFETTLTVPSDHSEEGLLKPLAAGVDKQLASTQAAIRVALLHESELARIDPDPQLRSPTDAVRHGPAQPSQLIQDVAREDDRSPPPCGTARAKAVSDDRLVPEERVLHAGRPMIARGLLPASPSSLLDRQDRAITRARPRAVSRHVGRTRRRHHERWRPALLHE